MANENINKVVYGNDVLIDLTNDSVSPQTLLTGTTAHDRSGSQITGQATQGHTIINASGTSMDAESGLQFATMKVEDDPTNGKTIVRHIEQLTQAQYDALPSSKLTDNIIREIIDGQAGQIQANNVGYGNTLVSTELARLESDKENAHTVLSQTLASGSTTVTFTNIPTTGDYIIEFATSAGINYTAIDTTTAGQVTLTYPEQSSSVTVYCDIKEV